MSNPTSPLTATVIVPAYNAATTIGPCLTALQNQVLSAETTLEIIIVDDCSTDNTPSVIQNSGATLLQLPHNQGRSAARNAGAHAATGDILLFTDADCEPLLNWVESMLAPFRADADVVGVKGAYLCKQNNLIARFTQLELTEKYDVMAQLPTISFIDTYSAAFRRDVFIENGGFDKTLVVNEDQDFSFRLAERGYKMMFAPGARVYHQHVTSPTRYYKRKAEIGRWKPEVLRRHPERAGSDSRTPLTQKVQCVLAMILSVLLPLALFSRWAQRLFGGLGSLFLLSSLPFLAKGAQRDPLATLIAVPMLFVRAAGLAHGFVIGTLKVMVEQRK